MSWLRLTDGFASNSKIVALSDGELRVWIRLLCHCASAHDPTVDKKTRLEVAGLTRKRVEKFTENALLDAPGTQSSNSPGVTLPTDVYEVHDWTQYQPKDATSAERQARWRARKRVTSGVTTTVTPSVTPAVTETSTSRAGTPAFPSSPVLKNSSLSQTSTEDPEKREREKLSEAEQARQAAWQERAQAPDIDSPAAFVAYGIRSGNWPDPYEPREHDKRRERAIENGSGSGPAYVAGLIRNHVITERHELETELDLAGLDGEERAALVTQFDLAHAIAERKS